MPDDASTLARASDSGRPDITQPHRIDGATWIIPPYQHAMRDGEIRWYRYVPHYRLLAYLMAGWRYDCDLGDIHGAYSCLMTWAGEGEPSEP